MLALSLAVATPVHADGGASAYGASGGTNSATSAGGAGGAGGGGAGGEPSGGGGAGVTGGAGGTVTSGVTVTPGGAGGIAGGGDGGNGVSTDGVIGTGGGGGAHGYVGVTLPIGGSTISGGKGGNGAGPYIGGGGGAGGWGAVITGTGVLDWSSIAVLIGGGAGGHGGPGDDSSSTGDGGSGGHGLYFTSDVTLTTGSGVAITAGAGGNGDVGGAGGAGLVFAPAGTSTATIGGSVQGGVGGAGRDGAGGRGGDAISGGILFLTLDGAATGGNGGDTSYYGAAGFGGAGITVSSSLDATINAAVKGGNGGASNDGGAGGQGGAGIVGGSVDLIVNATVAGGSGGYDTSIGGGSGGDGISGTNVVAVVNANISGGGGAFGSQLGSGLAASNGGRAISATGTLDLTVNSGTISGGNAGGATSVAGTGAGGVAISGGTLGSNVVLGANAVIIAGLSGMSEFANAIEFTGGTNVLELRGNGGISGQTYAAITGDVVGTTNVGVSNTLRFGGAGGAFNATLIDNGSGGQFKNFTAFDIDTTGTWIITGSTQPGTPATIVPLTVTAGTLQLGDANDAGGLVVAATVLSGARLSNDPTGTQMGAVHGGVTVESGGHLSVTQLSAPASAFMLGSGSLVVNSGANLDVKLGAPTSTGIIFVGNSVTLNGALNITDNGAMAAGSYLLIQYAGSMSGAGLTVGTAPGDYEYTIDTSTTAGQVILLVAEGGLYWNGTTTGGSTSSVVGGTGTWSANGSTNWTNSGGTSHVAWSDGKNAVFAGTAGTVWVDTSSGPVVAKGLKFITSGYELAADSTGYQLTLANASAQPKVDVVGAATVATISAGVIGTDGLEKAGDGTLILTADNSYSGGTTITAGTLQLGAGGTSGSITGNVTDNGTLAFNRSDAVTYSDVISGAGTLEKTGAGTLSLTGANTYTGGTTISAGTLQLGSGGTSGAIAGNVTNNSALVFNRSDDVTFSGVISGTGTVGKSGAGTLTLSGANTYSGATTVTSGTLRISSAAALGATSAGTSVASGATLLLDNPSVGSSTLTFNAEPLTLAGTGVGGNGALQTASFNVTSFIGFSGPITLAADTLIKNAGPQLELTGDVTASGANLTLAGNSWTKFYGKLALGSGGIEVTEGTASLLGASTYTGETLVNGGTLVIGNSQALGATSGGTSVASGSMLVLENAAGIAVGAEALTLSGAGAFGGIYGALVNSTGANSMAGAITLAADIKIMSMSGNLTLSGGISGTGKSLELASQGGSGVISGVINTGSGGVTVSGGTWTFTGANTYTGTTTISSGTLNIGKGGTSGSIVGDVVDNGTLVFNRSDNSTYSGDISGTGFLQKAGAGTLVATGNITTASTTMILGGALQIGDGGTTGSITSNVDTGSGPTVGALVFNRSNDVAYGGTLQGYGTVEQAGTGTLTLSAPSLSFSGFAKVSSGTLALASAAVLGGSVEVKDGARLTGTGTVVGNIALKSGATLAGTTGSTLRSFGTLSFNSNSTLAVTLLAPSTTAVVSTGGLNLDGTLNLTAGSGFSSGTYRLIDYSGTLNDGGLEIGTTPAHSLFTVDTSTGGQVNLIVMAGQWWNGATTSAAGAVTGGTGTWDVAAAATNWTDEAGATSFAWTQGSLAIFAGPAGGAVTVSGATAPQVAGMEFLVDGYEIQGGGIAVQPFSAGARPRITVGDDTPASGGITATIASALTGTAGLQKAGRGTLVLTGSDSFSGELEVLAGSLVVSSGGQLTSGAGTIASAAGSAAAVTVTGSGSQWNLGNNDLNLGYGGAGTLVVSAGGTVNSAYGTLGYLAGSSGTATVTGAGSSWQLASGYGIYAGYYGSGSLTISDGGSVVGHRDSYLGYDSTVTGTITVTGAGSTWDVGTSEITVGYYGHGALVVSDGATVTSGYGTLGYYGGSVGTATVTGIGSTWDMGSDGAYVGYEGTGSLTISAGGKVLSASSYVGSDADAPGTVLVTGTGSTWDLGSHDVSIGYSGAGTVSSLTVADGGTVTSGSGYLGVYSNAIGIATVTGVGSSWNLGTSTLYIGYDGGTGTLNIENGGTVTSGAAIVAETSSSPGTANVNGAGSTWNLGIGSLSVGASGTGVLTVSSGGTVLSGEAYIGEYGGASGAATVTGTGSTWNLGAGALYVGSGATGTLLVADGGTVQNSGNAYIGRDAGVSGTVTVTGAGSSLNLGSGYLYVGSSGNGTLLVESGGSVTSSVGYLGSLAGSSGTATVTGAGSSWNLGTQFLLLGYSGSTGALTIADGGTVTAWQVAKAWNATGASVTFDGGVLKASRSESDFIYGFASGELNLAAGGGTIDSNGFDVGTSSVLSGIGALTKTGAGTLTLTGDSVYTGGTTVSAGTLRIGDGGTSGSILGAIANSGIVEFNRSDAVTAPGAITGTGALVQAGSGTLTLVGANSAAAGTTVAAGTLEILSGVSLASDIVVEAGATLKGETSGTAGAAVAGVVTVRDGGTLKAAPTASAGVHGLAMTGLTLSSGSILDVTLGSNTGNAVFSAGTLTLDGVLNVTDAGGMALGVYRILSYGTLAADNGLALGTTPTQYAYEIQQAPGQVNLAVLNGDMLYWNGTTTTPDGTVHGGSGTWNASTGVTNWLTAPLNQSRAWSSSFAVFAGAPGTVTVNASDSTPAVTGMQFMVDGYQVVGGRILLDAPLGQTQIRVGDGTPSGASIVATIGSVLRGTTGLEKTDLGTLILTGENTYTGGTTVTQGTLQIGDGGTSGAILGDVVNNARLAFNRADDVTFAEIISGTGAVVKKGAGTLALTGANTYAGGTIITEGAVQVTSAGALGTGSLALEGGGALRASGTFTYATGVSLTPVAGTGGGTLAVDDGQMLTVSGVVSGTGALTKSGAGDVTLAGANTFTGATTVAAGRMFLSGGASLADGARLTVAAGAGLALTDADETVGSLAGGGAIALNGYCLTTGGDGTSSTFSGTIGGSGCLAKTGDGTLTLTGVSTYAGGTSVSGGTVQVYDGGALGSGPLSLSGGGTLRASGSFSYGQAISLTPVGGVGGGTFEVDEAETLTLSGAIAGLGSLAKTGTGTLVLGGANSYGGATDVTAGTLVATGGGAIGDASAVSVAAGARFVLQAAETVGSIAGAGGIELGASLTIGGNNASTTFAGAITGTGGLAKTGSGTLTLSGASTYSGPTAVNAGTLAVDGSLSGDVYVHDQATLSGGGTIAQTVHVLNGGTLAGTQASGLTMGGLDLSSGATLAVGLGAVSQSAVFNVNGNVTLDGTLDVSASTGFGLGIYRVIRYTGALTDNGLEVGTMPLGYAGSMQTALAGQVNLVVEDPNSPILFWNGPHTSPTQAVEGGTGTWTAGPQTNWTNASGTLSKAWNSGFAVFQAGPGTVNVDNGQGQVTALGMQFVDTGYVVSGGDILLSGAAPAPIRVGDGTQAGAGTRATIASVLKGASGVEKSDFGTLVLTGANTYTGGTTISGGTLQLGNGGATGSILGDVVNNATLAFDLSGESTFSGAISGTGRVVQQGAGTVTLSGANSFSGGLSIASGTVRAASAGALGSGALGLSGAGALSAAATFAYGGGVTLAAVSGSGGGTFAVDTAQALTLSGVVSGNGALTKSGGGTLILTGTNTYAGGTVIAAGTLQLGDGGTTGSIVGDVVNNASLVFNRSDSYAFTGSISGAGQVTFTGGGNVVFSAPYQGPVAVDNSAVVLERGTVTASPFTVNAGGTLGGTATIGGLTVNAGGIAAPGYSPGTLTVNGAVAFNAGAVYRVDVTPAGAHDLIIASGAVTLSNGATVEVLAEKGRYPASSTVAILTTSGTVSGTFGGVTSDYAFLDPTLSYDAQNVYLTLGYTGIDFISYARTMNEAGVAVAAQALGAGNAIYDAILSLPEGAVAPAFNALTGEVYASVDGVLQQQSIYVREAVGTRLRQAAEGPDALGRAAQGAGPAMARLSRELDVTLWAHGYGGWGNGFGNGNAASVSSSLGGFLIGADVAVAPNAWAGVFGGYSRSSFDVDARASSGNSDNYDVGFYAGGQFGAWALRGGFAYGWHDISTSRMVSFPGFSQNASAGYSTGTTQVFGEVGYDVALGGFGFEPFAGLAYVNVAGASFSEGLSSAALAVDTAAMDTLYSTLGVRAATSVQLFGRALTPSVTLGWQHAFGDTAPSAAMRFLGGATPFAVSGVPIAADTLLVNAGLAYGLTDAATLAVTYSGQFATSATQNAFSAQFSLKF
ncbi:autotransporter-associated beta strand repeat-containing protein [Xanthobacter sp. V2C-8]|uniref:autotransporter-associated beta strand repeat-containing protein n=1 Tax=Xanthobacter albus TaxID=3119929 RepID=UPI0037293874